MTTKTTNETTTKTPVMLLAIACVLALSACGGTQDAAEGHGAEAAHTSSSAGLPQGNIAAGKALASTRGASGQSCVDCHGAEGNAPIDASYPKLGGQYHDYIEHSIQAYRSGDREHALMSTQAITLSDQQIADLGAYFGSVKGQLKDLHGAE